MKEASSSFFAPSVRNPSINDRSWGEWFEEAKSKTKEFGDKAHVLAEIATKIAQEKGIEIARQARELSEKYDLELARNAIMSKIGGPVDTSTTEMGNGQRNKSVLDLVYVTENLISMAFPRDFKKSKHSEGGNDIEIVSRFLRQRHGSHFMIWNVSEEIYDYSYFSHQVLEYKFPGHPSPPLGLLFKICASVKSWLDADEKNVAVIHCITGKGRTAALMACILTWIDEFSTPMEALQYVAERRGILPEYLTIPSQRRYLQYFSNVLDNIQPRPEPLLLRRVIISSIPIFGKFGNKEGCCPYIQLFKCGKLVATAAPPSQNGNSHLEERGIELKWVTASEGHVSFNINSAVQGDFLLRCRHADTSGVRVSIFRAAFHTGYIPSSGVLRLSKSDLDGASSDPKFDEDFFVDLIFAPIEQSNTTSNVGDSRRDHESSDVREEIDVTDIQNNRSQGIDNTTNIDSIKFESTTGSTSLLPPPSISPLLDDVISPSIVNASTVDASLISDSGLLIDESCFNDYEETLHRDTSFWEAILARKNGLKSGRSRKYASSSFDRFSISDDISSSSNSDDIDAMRNFASSPMITERQGFHSGQGSHLDVTSTLSDLDLIKQLACLEEEEEEKKLEDSDLEISLGDIYLSKSDFEGSNNTNQKLDESNILESTSLRLKRPVESLIPTRVSEELQALDEFEKELGLIEKSDKRVLSSSTPEIMHSNDIPIDTPDVTDSDNRDGLKAASELKVITDVELSKNVNSIEVDDDLDEIEKYLQSLSS